MSNAWPSAATVSEFIDKTDAPEAPPAAPVTPPVAPVVEAPKPEAQPGTPPTTPAAVTPTDDVSDVIKRTVTEKGGARQFIESLTDEVRDQLQDELYRNLHRKLSARTSERDNLTRQMGAMQTNLEGKIEERFDELMTHGLSPEDTKKYFDERKLKTIERQERSGAQNQQVLAQEYQRRLGTAWAIVTRAGLPADPNDPRVQALDWATDETDFDAAMTRLQMSVERTARSATTAPRTPVTAPTPVAAAPDEAAVKKLAQEMAEGIVRDELRKAGILKPDTGKPGSGSGSAAPVKNWKDARAAVMTLLEDSSRS